MKTAQAFVLLCIWTPFAHAAQVRIWSWTVPALTRLLQSDLSHEQKKTVAWRIVFRAREHHAPELLQVLKDGILTEPEDTAQSLAYIYAKATEDYEGMLRHCRPRPFALSTVLAEMQLVAYRRETTESFSDEVRAALLDTIEAPAYSDSYLAARAAHLLYRPEALSASEAERVQAHLRGDGLLTAAQCALYPLITPTPAQMERLETTAKTSAAARDTLRKMLGASHPSALAWFEKKLGSPEEVREWAPHVPLSACVKLAQTPGVSPEVARLLTENPRARERLEHFKALKDRSVKPNVEMLREENDIAAIDVALTNLGRRKSFASAPLVDFFFDARVDRDRFTPQIRGHFTNLLRAMDVDQFLLRLDDADPEVRNTSARLLLRQFECKWRTKGKATVDRLNAIMGAITEGVFAYPKSLSPSHLAKMPEEGLAEVFNRLEGADAPLRQAIAQALLETKLPALWAEWVAEASADGTVPLPDPIEQRLNGPTLQRLSAIRSIKQTGTPLSHLKALRRCVDTNRLEVQLAAVAKAATIDLSQFSEEQKRELHDWMLTDLPKEAASRKAAITIVLLLFPRSVTAWATCLESFEWKTAFHFNFAEDLDIALEARGPLPFEGTASDLEALRRLTNVLTASKVKKIRSLAQAILKRLPAVSPATEQTECAQKVQGATPAENE